MVAKLREDDLSISCCGFWCALFVLVASLVYPAIAIAATPAISTGGTHSVALKSDGSISTWGNDASGQQGVGRALGSSSPLVVPGTTSIVAIASGYSHVIALKADGTLLAWGSNTDGQLGDGTTTNRSNPTAVSGLTEVDKIWAQGSHNFARKRDGSLWAWGSNGVGQLGDGSYDKRLVPTRLTGINNVADLSLGGSHTLARRSDGTVWAWGSNDYGQLGDGTKTELYTGRATPVQVIGLSNAQDIAAGARHSLARKSDGSVVAWGAGPLGDGTAVDRLSPVAVTGLANAAYIAAGAGHSYAIRSDGSAVGWGSNGYAELGDNTYDDRLTIVPLGGLSGATKISAGFLHNIALLSGGTLAVWGNNDYGQLGDGTIARRFLPSPLAGISGIKDVVAGDLHTVALRNDGTVLAWGDNTSGQLGNGTRLIRSTPIVLALSGVAKFSAGGAHTVALKADGSVFAWGNNCCGQIGDATQFTNRSAPVPVSGLGAPSGVADISAGALFTLARKSDGTVLSWGANDSGQLGVRSGTDASKPAQVTGLTAVSAIAAGADFSLALKSDGTVLAWGRNDSGQLGDGTITKTIYEGRATPQRVGSLSGITAISAGFQHAAALKSDGTVMTWGSNGGGRLGDGTTINRLTPVQVSGLTDVMAIAAGDTHTLALKKDGTVWAWGSNYSYQLGDGTGTERVLPVQIMGLTGIVAISTSLHSFALRNDGTVLAWGRNDFGHIGDGTLVDRPAPVVVLRENGAGSVVANNWFLDLNPAITKAIPTEKVPVFLAVATPVANDITANFQFRAADVGSNPNLYVFALAPASMVRNVSAEALADHKGPVSRSTSTTNASTPLPCVLAQLNASGQLTAVTAGSLQAYLTGVLSSQGASVSVLNGVSTALLSGAVFYVGYGSSSTSMINGGTNRSIVAVPGSQSCQPQAPQTGWWWFPAQDGRGFGIEVRGNTLFMSGYLYDDTGRATWVVAAGATALDGSFFNNTLYHVSNGQTLTGQYKAPAPVTLDGQITLTFNDARNGTLIWPGGSIPIQRFDDVIGSGNGITPAFVPENGWWWNESESGRGFFMEFKNNFAFIAGYMYEADGRPVWYTAQSTMASPQRLSTSWLQVANGQTLTGPYKKPVVINSNVGPVTIQFSDAANAILTLPGGRNIAITRHRF